MVSYRLIGSGVTDSNGVASYTYTGQGSGEVDLIASTSNPITDGSLVSETYELLDCLIYDDCTSETSGRWYNYNNILSVQYGTDGVTFTKSEENTTQRYIYYNDSTISTVKIGGYNTITTPSTIEFNVSAITDTIQLVFVDSNNNQRFIEISSIGLYKLVMNGSTLVIYKDGQQQGSSYVLDGANTQFRFGFNAQNESITFKDLAIYPI